MHISLEGHPLYKQRWAYVGDFKNGMAVVCRADGMHTHIHKNGEFVHHRWFLDLNVYHKGYACAKDAEGWFHIDLHGKACYPQRFTSIEPFYNRLARAQDKTGKYQRINSSGDLVHSIANEQKPAHVSADLVGFWKTEILATAARLKLFSYLPADLQHLGIKTKLPQQNLLRILKALWELCIISPDDQKVWNYTAKGKAYQNSFFADASIMWSQINSQAWKKLPLLLAEHQSAYHPSIKELEKDQTLLDHYLKALDGYAAMDLSSISFDVHAENVIAFGRAGKTFLDKMKNASKKSLVCHPALARDVSYPLLDFDPRQPWPICGDIVSFFRYLHYYPDEDVQQILTQARKALPQAGAILIFEMVTDAKTPSGGMLDLNMWIETGGKLRDKDQWDHLIRTCGFSTKRFEKLSEVLTWIEIQ